MKVKALFLFVSLMLLASCVRQQEENIPYSQPGDTLTVTHAGGFYVHYHEAYKEVVVINPWQKEEVFARYYLVSSRDQEVPSNGMKIVVPVKTVAITSATHTEFLQLLSVISDVTGICSPNLIYNPFLRERIERNELVDLGDSFSINVEKTMLLNPDMVVMSGYNQNDPNAKRLMQAGVPVVYNNEWMEGSLLARAEWIRFMSLFWNKEHEADSIFCNIESDYLRVKELASATNVKPTIMSGSNFRGTWYKPGGGSFMARLYSDAGGSYFYANDSSRGSLPLQVETVIRNFADADVWLNCNFKTIDELLEADRKHALFSPVANARVYHFNKRMLPSGANDYWESAIARPDLLLMDVIKMLHPELLPEHDLVYAGKLE